MPSASYFGQVTIVPVMPVSIARHCCPLRALPSRSGTHHTGGRIDGSRQAVRQRHVEHVVGHLPGGIAGAAGIVKEGDVETAQTGLVGRQHVELPPPASCSPLSGKSSSNTNTESFDGGNGVGCVSTVTADCLKMGDWIDGDRSAAHAVAAPVMRCARASKGFGRIARKNRDVVALGGIQVDLAGSTAFCLRARPANAVADVAHHRRCRARSGPIRRTTVPVQPVATTGM